MFGQVEYATEKVSAFFQGSVSEQMHQRFDRYDYLPEYKDAKKVDNFGFNTKGGVAYNITGQHTVFVNAGYYSRQPYHDNIYLNYTNAVNPLTENEKILGLEAGYTFTSSIFTANLNVYRTSWKDRVTTTSTVLTADGTIGTTPVSTGDLIYTTSQNDEQLHTGAEVDFTLKPIKTLSVKGFASVGNWEYRGNAVQRKYNEGLDVLDESKVDIEGGKVGDAAQTTWG
ncbi:TonB-dependent receptor [Flavobacterium sediminis]|uniref:TonB-dependent receptor n=1 Tax=Flavobacterium sediminis TaxID=2201181 RepID=UPI0026D5A3A0|nr:TonB-dependent receptor [Flavobacterium sediminis]